VGEKETATAEDLAGADARTRTGNLMQMDDDPARATTVKSSKSNSSEIAGVPGEEEDEERVKGSKSNSSERTVKGSKSNTSERWQDDNTDDDEEPKAERATTVKSGKSNTSD
jgi:hypothetical protein